MEIQATQIPRRVAERYLDFKIIGMTTEQMEKPKEVKLPIKFYAGYFHDADGHMIAQMRGWGWIQYLENAEDLQDSIGEWIAWKINQ